MAITNILYFIKIREKYTVKHDTKGNYFVVVGMDRVILFRQSTSRMYFHGMSNCNIVLINTVKEIREGLPRVNMKGPIRCNRRRIW